MSQCTPLSNVYTAILHITDCVLEQSILNFNRAKQIYHVPSYIQKCSLCPLTRIYKACRQSSTMSAAHNTDRCASFGSFCRQTLVDLPVSPSLSYSDLHQLRSYCVRLVIGEPPRPVLHKRAAPAGFNSALKHALVEEAAHEFDLEHDPTMVSTPSQPEQTRP